VLGKKQGSTRFEYVRVNPQVAPGSVVKGEDTMKTPEWKAGFSVQYEFSLGRAGNLTPRFDITPRSRVKLIPGEISSPFQYQGGFTLVNARLAWQSLNNDWAAALSVTNATDVTYYDNARDLRDGFGYAQGQVAWPREWAFQVTRRF